MPCRVRSRMAVNQQNRRATPSMTHAQPNRPDIHVIQVEAIEHDPTMPDRHDTQRTHVRDASMRD